MASTKRPSSLAPCEDNIDIPTKRLRGGNGPPFEEDYYLDEEEMPEEMEPPEEIDSRPALQSVFSDITDEMRQRWL